MLADDELPAWLQRPAVDHQALESAAQQTRGIFDEHGAGSPEVDFSSTPLNPEAAHGINEALDPLTGDYPGVARNIRKIEAEDFHEVYGEDHDGANEAMAAVTAGEDSGLYINSREFRDLAAYERNGAWSEENGWCVPGSGSLRGTVTHEFGHHVMEKILNDPQALNEINQVISDHLRTPYDASLEEHPPAAQNVIERGVSITAGVNPHEFIAELFTEHRLADNPRELARAVGEVIDRHFLDPAGRRADPTVLQGEPSSAHGPAADHTTSAPHAAPVETAPVSSPPTAGVDHTALTPESLARSRANESKPESHWLNADKRTVRSVTYKTGLETVEKTAKRPAIARAEFIGAKFGRKLGGHFAEVLMDGDRSVVMSRLKGSPADNRFGNNEFFKQVGQSFIESSDGRILAVHSILLGDSDYQIGNLHIYEGPNGEIRMGKIDFESIELGLGVNPRTNPFTHEFVHHSGTLEPIYIDNPLSPHDIDFLRRIVEEMRPDFEWYSEAAHPGQRDHFYNQVVERLDKLEAHATGTEPILAPKADDPVPHRTGAPTGTEDAAPRSTAPVDGVPRGDAPHEPPPGHLATDHLPGERRPAGQGPADHPPEGGPTGRQPPWIDAPPPEGGPTSHQPPFADAPRGNAPHEPPPGHLASEHLSGGHEPVGRGPAGHPTEGGPTGHQPPSAGTPPAGHQGAAGREPAGHDQPTTNEPRWRFRRGRDDDPTPSPEQGQRPTDEQGVHDERTKGAHTDHEPRAADGSDVRRSTPAGEPDPAGTTDSAGRTDEVADHRADGRDGGADVLGDLPPHQKDAVERLLDDDGVRRLNEALASDDPQVRAEAQAWAQDASEGLSACPVADRETVYHYTSLPADRMAELVPGADVTMHGMLDTRAVHTPDHGQPVELVVHSRSGAVITDRVIFHPETRFRVLAEEHYTLPMRGEGWRPIHRIFLAELPADGTSLPGTVGHPGIEAPRRPMDERLQQIHSYREPTDAGAAYFHPNEEDYHYTVEVIAQSVKPIDGVFHFDMHADPSRGLVGDEALTGQDIATLLSHEPTLADPPPDGRLLILRSGACESGLERHGLAQDIANETGLIVIAPDKEVWYDTAGNAHVSEPMTVDADGRPHTPYPPEGAWRIFVPEDRHSLPPSHEPSPGRPEDGGTPQHQPATDSPHEPQPTRPPEASSQPHDPQPTQPPEAPSQPHDPQPTQPPEAPSQPHDRQRAPEDGAPSHLANDARSEPALGPDAAADPTNENRGPGDDGRAAPAAPPRPEGLQDGGTREPGPATGEPHGSQPSQPHEPPAEPHHQQPNGSENGVSRELGEHPAGTDPHARRREELARSVATGIDPKRTILLGRSDTTETHATRAERVELVTFNDGTRAIRKVTEEGWEIETDAEELGALVGNALDAPVPAVYRESDRVVYMDYIEGDLALILHPDTVHPAELDHLGYQNTLGGRLLGLLDVLIGNADRHNANWIIDEHGNVVGIDHNNAFRGAHADPSRNSFAGNYVSEISHVGRFQFDYAWKHNDLSRSDVALIRSRLEALRPEFERLDRDDWYNEMMKRFRHIEENAKGTTSLLASDEPPSAGEAGPAHPDPGATHDSADPRGENRDPGDDGPTAPATPPRPEGPQDPAGDGSALRPDQDGRHAPDQDGRHAPDQDGRHAPDQEDQHSSDHDDRSSEPPAQPATETQPTPDGSRADAQLLEEGRRVARDCMVTDPTDDVARTLARMNRILEADTQATHDMHVAPPVMELAETVGLSARPLVRIFEEAQARGFDPAGTTDRAGLVDALNRHRAADPYLWNGTVLVQELVHIPSLKHSSNETLRALAQMDETLGSVRGSYMYGLYDDPLVALSKDLGMATALDPLGRLFDDARAHGLDPATVTDHDSLLAALDAHRRSDPRLWEGLAVADALKITAPSDPIARALSHMDEICRSPSQEGPGYLAGDALSDFAAWAGSGDDSAVRFASAFVEAEMQGLNPAQAGDRWQFMTILDRLAEADPLFAHGLSIAENLELGWLDPSTARTLARIDEIIGTDHLRGDQRQGVDPLLRLADDLGLGHSTDRLIRMFEEAENHGFRPAEAADRDALIAAFDRLRATDPLWDGIRISERFGVEGASDSTARALGEMARIVGSGRGSRPFAVDPLARLTEETGLDYSLGDLAHLFTDAQEGGHAPERAADRTELADILNRHRESSDPGTGTAAPADHPSDPRTTTAAEDHSGATSDVRGAPSADAPAHDPAAVQESRLVAEGKLRHAREEVDRLTRDGGSENQRELAMERLRSLEARVDAWARWPDEPEVSYTADHEAFRQDYLQAVSRAERGETVVPYLYENATGGLGARNGGRAFGLELEISGPKVNSTEMLHAIARDLHAHGLTRSADVGNYHAAKDAGYSDARNAWRVEFDSSVDGEIVSPILYDEPETWEAIAKVCEIVTSHGGKVDFSTGGHIHVSTHDYDHIVINHDSVMRMTDSYMDTLFRLGQNPDAYRHRGVRFCQPNKQLTTGYSSIGDVTGRNDGHNIAVNMSGMHEGKQSDHIEFRLWDGSLDPAVIQTRVKLSLAITEAAFRHADGLLPPNGGLRDPLGAHLEERRLGADHEHPQGTGPAESLSFRRLMDDIFYRAVDKEQATALFAMTRWTAAA
ncbi:amidoligase family protein [Actinoallomurus sp. NPDC050550]|uniref:amidoligase family protein n=1 Tax=Actinoallomurus sp. NPDC050550 TaxID=3154937 RepID=UPI0033CD4C7E